MAIVIRTKSITSPSTSGGSESVVDSSWETVDPNPDIQALFVLFNDRLFYGALGGCVVQWSPRMTYCAGVCVYEGRGGLCSIRLSEPLLKFRPRKDLVETLLHEMIHAYLFVTVRDRDRDGHGPQFQAHMKRINAETGANVTIYHNYYAEVDYHRQHWWRCTGPCKDRPPYFGYVKRSMNRPSGPNDNWHDEHQRTCGGQFEKIKEPDSSTKVKQPEDSRGKKPGSSKKSKEADSTNSKASGGSRNTKRNGTDRFPGNGHVLGDGGGKMRRLEEFFTVSGKSEENPSAVSCPICQTPMKEADINQHLDDCLTQSMLKKEKDGSHE